MLIIKKLPNQLIFVGEQKVPLVPRYKLNAQQLEISNLKGSDSGTYVCELSTSGQPLEVRHELTVHTAPNVTALGPKEQRVNKVGSSYVTSLNLYPLNIST